MYVETRYDDRLDVNNRHVHPNAPRGGGGPGCFGHAVSPRILGSHLYAKGNTPLFAPGPGPIPNPTPAQLLTPDLELIAPHPLDGSQKISSEPKMPDIDCQARLWRFHDGEVTFEWTFHVEFVGRGCTTTGTYTGTSRAMNDSVTTWRVPFGDEFRGGEVTVEVTAREPTGHTYTKSVLAYRIEGEEPSNAEKTTEIGTGTQPWYIRQIAQHESGIRQFLPDGMPKLNVSPGDGGAGIFQITGANQLPNHVWNWKENVAKAKSIIHDNSLAATTFWNRQVQQFNQWNADHPGATVAPPHDVTYGSTTFSFSPTGNQKSFADAIAIKMFNGAAHHFIVWKNNGADASHPFWRIDPTPNYVSNVL